MDIHIHATLKSLSFQQLYFYCAAWNADAILWWEFCPSVCPTVHLSKAWIVTKRQKNMFRFLYDTKDNLSYFYEKKNGWWGATPSTWNIGSTDPHWSEVADFEQIITHNASAVTPSKISSINTNRKSTMRFPVSLRWSSYLAPKHPKGGSKSKTAVFPAKLHFAWRKSATKFLCVKTVSSNVVGHSLA